MPEDQPGGYVAVQQYGRHRAVFGAQLVVQAVRVLFGLGAVEASQAAGADTEAVGRALGGGTGPVASPGS